MRCSRPNALERAYFAHLFNVASWASYEAMVKRPLLEKPEELDLGCTDKAAVNYDPLANKDDLTCIDTLQSEDPEDPFPLDSSSATLGLAPSLLDSLLGNTLDGAGLAYAWVVPLIICLLATCCAALLCVRRRRKRKEEIEERKRMHAVRTSVQVEEEDALSQSMTDEGWRDSDSGTRLRTAAPGSPGDKAFSTTVDGWLDNTRNAELNQPKSPRANGPGAYATTVRQRKISREAAEPMEGECPAASPSSTSIVSGDREDDGEVISASGALARARSRKGSAIGRQTGASSFRMSAEAEAAAASEMLARAAAEAPAAVEQQGPIEAVLMGAVSIITRVRKTLTPRATDAPVTPEASAAEPDLPPALGGKRRLSKVRPINVTGTAKDVELFRDDTGGGERSRTDAKVVKPRQIIVKPASETMRDREHDVLEQPPGEEASITSLEPAAEAGLQPRRSNQSEQGGDGFEFRAPHYEPGTIGHGAKASDKDKPSASPPDSSKARRSVTSSHESREWPETPRSHDGRTPSPRGAKAGKGDETDAPRGDWLRGTRTAVGLPAWQGQEAQDEAPAEAPPTPRPVMMAFGEQHTPTYSEGAWIQARTVHARPAVTGDDAKLGESVDYRAPQFDPNSIMHDGADTDPNRALAAAEAGEKKRRKGKLRADGSRFVPDERLGQTLPARPAKSWQPAEQPKPTLSPRDAWFQPLRTAEAQLAWQAQQRQQEEEERLRLEQERAAAAARQAQLAAEEAGRAEAARLAAEAAAEEARRAAMAPKGLFTRVRHAHMGPDDEPSPLHSSSENLQGGHGSPGGLPPRRSATDDEFTARTSGARPTDSSAHRSPADWREGDQGSMRGLPARRLAANDAATQGHAGNAVQGGSSRPHESVDFLQHKRRASTRVPEGAVAAHDERQARVGTSLAGAPGMAGRAQRQSWLDDEQGTSHEQLAPGLADEPRVRARAGKWEEEFAAAQSRPTRQSWLQNDQGLAQEEQASWLEPTTQAAPVENVQLPRPRVKLLGEEKVAQRIMRNSWLAEGQGMAQGDSPWQEPSAPRMHRTQSDEQRGGVRTPPTTTSEYDE